MYWGRIGIELCLKARLIRAVGKLGLFAIRVNAGGALHFAHDPASASALRAFEAVAATLPLGGVVWLVRLGQVSTEALLSRETVGCDCRMTKRPVAPSKPVAYAKAKEGERADGLKRMTSAEAEQADLRERLSLSCLKRFGPRLAYLPRPDLSEGSASASRRGC